MSDEDILTNTNDSQSAANSDKTVYTGDATLPFGHIEGSKTYDGELLMNANLSAQIPVLKGTNFNLSSGYDYSTQMMNYNVGLDTRQQFGDFVNFNAKIDKNNQNLSYGADINYSQQFNKTNVSANASYDSNGNSYNVNGAVESTVGKDTRLTANASYDSNSDSFNANGTVKSTVGKDTTLTANASYDSNSNSYNVNGTVESSVGKDTRLTATANHSNETSSIKIEGHKPRLINRDNIDGTQDNTQERKESLVENQDRFNFSVEEGYSKSTGYFSNHSLMYRANDNTFISGNYNVNSEGQSFGAELDTKPAKINYTGNIIKNDEQKTYTHDVSAMFKGRKNQYIVNYNTSKNVVQDQVNTQSKLGGDVVLNRTQFGEFSEGFNADVAGDVSFTNGKCDGFDVKLDGAYNKYRFGTNGNDYLGSAVIEYKKHQDTSVFTARTCNAYRINNERTTFEQNLRYTNTANPYEKTDKLEGSLGVYQQLGKNHGDVCIYAKTVLGKTWSPSGNDFDAEVRAGAKIKPTKKLSLDGNVGWKESNNFSGSLTLGVNL